MSNRAPTANIEELLAHSGWARRLARRLTVDDDAAEDLLQETWMAASLHPPDADRPLQPWLAVVLRNLFLKRTVAERRRETRQAAVALQGQVVSPDQLAEKVQTHRILAELVGTLDEPFRETLILRYFEELSAAEIARRLDVPAGTVRWRLKRALEELKRQLDVRHDGRRSTWLAAVLPLAEGNRPRPRAWLWPVGIAVVASAVGLGWGLAHSGQWPSGAAGGGAGMALPGGPPANVTSTIADPPPSGSPPPPAGQARLAVAPNPEDLAGCQLEVQRLRRESAEVEAQRQGRLHPKELFAIGAPNPVAAAALTPAIDRILKGTRPAAPSHTLECRTLACRLLVAQTREEHSWTNEWQLPLQRDDEMRERTRGVGFFGGMPSKDPVSGVVLFEREIFLRLSDPSGARVDRSKPPAIPALPAGPEIALPGTRDTCLAQRDKLRAEIRATRAEMEANATPMERFGRAPADPKLSQAMRANLVAKFSDRDTAALDLQCRGNLCRALWPDGPVNWQNELFRETWYRKLVDGMTVGPGGVYLKMAGAPRADGMSFLEDLVTRFARSRAPDDCAARFPSAGALLVKFELPRTSHPVGPTEATALAATYGETLAGTPLGKCMENAIADTILSAPLPTLPVGGAVLFKTFHFPRAPAGAKPAAGAKP